MTVKDGCQLTSSGTFLTPAFRSQLQQLLLIMQRDVFHSWRKTGVESFALESRACSVNGCTRSQPCPPTPTCLCFSSSILASRQRKLYILGLLRCITRTGCETGCGWLLTRCACVLSLSLLFLVTLPSALSRHLSVDLSSLVPVYTPLLHPF